MKLFSCVINKSSLLHARPVVPKDCALLFNLVDLMERVSACLQYSNAVCYHACCIHSRSTRSLDLYAYLAGVDEGSNRAVRALGACVCEADDRSVAHLPARERVLPVAHHGDENLQLEQLLPGGELVIAG